MKRITLIAIIMMASVLSLVSPAYADGPTETVRVNLDVLTAVGFSDGSVTVNNGYATVQFPPAPDLGAVRNIQFRPDGNVLAVVYDSAVTFIHVSNISARFEPARYDGCHILASAYEWLGKSQTAVFSLAMVCNGKVKVKTSVWAPEDSKDIILDLPDAR